MLLAAFIIGAWTLLHVWAVFFVEPISAMTALLLIVTISWLSVGLFIVAHDAMHGSLLPGRPEDGYQVGKLALMLYAGFSFSKLLPKHHSHHQYSGSGQDPDFYHDVLKGNRSFEVLAWYASFMKTYFGKTEMLIMVLRVGAYLLLGARVENILLFFAAPGLLSSFQLFYFGTYLPHRQTEIPFSDHHNARSNAFGYLASLLSCFHFGYHHEHHLHPATPWWRLPATRQSLSSKNVRSAANT